MKRLRLLCAVSALLLFAGCAEKAPVKREEIVFAMDTVMIITAYGDGAEKALSECKEEITRLEGLMSAGIEGSDVYKINASSGESVAVDADVTAALEAAARVSDATGGALDCTVYPLVTAWGFISGEHRIPPEDEIAKLLSNVGYKKVELNGGVRIADGQQLDLGAVAKGYLSDRLCEIMERSGVSSAVMTLGGNAATLGTKPDGSAWNVGIEDPDAPGEYLAVLGCSDGEKVITSGDYHRYFERDGVRYCHIIDPSTGYPVSNGLRSVSVVGTDGARCDALSTALFVMGREKALEFWEQNEGFGLVLITDDGEITVTADIAGHLAPENGTQITVYS